MESSIFRKKKKKKKKKRKKGEEKAGLDAGRVQSACNSNRARPPLDTAYHRVIYSRGRGTRTRVERGLSWPNKPRVIHTCISIFGVYRASCIARSGCIAVAHA